MNKKNIKNIILGAILSIVLLVLAFFMYSAIYIGLPNILIREKNVKIYNHDGVVNGAMLFKMNRTARFEMVDNYVLWLPSKSSVDNRIIVIIGKNSMKVGIPNSSNRDYKLFFNNFLYQSDGADWFVPFSDCVKGACFAPDLNINDNGISFKMPDSYNEDYSSIKIEFNHSY